MIPLILFTDLDGTLIDNDFTIHTKTRDLVVHLYKKNIPVVPVTSKTFDETTTLLQELNIRVPFAVENGSAVYLPSFANNNNLYCREAFTEHIIGSVSFPEAQSLLQAIGEEIGEPLLPMRSLSRDILEKKSGLTGISLDNALARHYSEPFVPPDKDFLRVLHAALNRQVYVLQGDRFWHLVSRDANKGAAVRYIAAYYAGQDGKWPVTIGLGNSPNDLEMLTAVDIPVAIAGTQGVHPALQKGTRRCSEAVGSLGWAESVEIILNEYNLLS